jgi:hypothetical protein
VRIQRYDDVIDAGRLRSDEPAQALHVFYRARHEKRPVRVAKVVLGVNNEESIAVGHKKNDCLPGKLVYFLQ